MAQRTSLPGYEDDAMKQEAKHVEFGEKTHVDLHDAAAPGHLATDEHGHALVSIDKAASDRLARKVCFTPSYAERICTDDPPQIDWHIVPIVALQYLYEPLCHGLQAYADDTRRFQIRLYRPGKHRKCKTGRSREGLEAYGIRLQHFAIQYVNPADRTERMTLTLSV